MGILYISYFLIKIFKICAQVIFHIQIFAPWRYIYIIKSTSRYHPNVTTAKITVWIPSYVVAQIGIWDLMNEHIIPLYFKSNWMLNLINHQPSVVIINKIKWLFSTMHRITEKHEYIMLKSIYSIMSKSCQPSHLGYNQITLMINATREESPRTLTRKWLLMRALPCL